MLETYRQQIAEREAQGIVPQPLSAQQAAGLVELLKSPPAGEEDFLLHLLTQRIPAGVDEAAYVKAGFLTAVAIGEVESPLVSRVSAVELLGTDARWLQHSASDRGPRRCRACRYCS